MARILRRVEEHVEEWRWQDAAHRAEANDNRDRLWAEATQGEKLLVEAMK